MNLGWKRSPKPAPGGGAPSAEPCCHQSLPRITRRSYWVRSSLITNTSVICSNCGRLMDGQRPVDH